jgi:hypothetical protein
MAHPLHIHTYIHPLCGEVLIETLPSNNLFWLHYSGIQASCQIAPSLSLVSNLRSCIAGVTEGGWGFMNYFSEMGSGVMINIPVYIMIDAGIQKLLIGMHMYVDTQTARWSHKPTFIF